MQPLQVLPSTTSHKREPLIPTLELFARLGFTDLDLNLNHVVERGIAVEEVQRALDGNGQRVRIVSGGWCDFFDAEPKIQATFESVERQVQLARAFGVNVLRLFFGRLEYDRYALEAASPIAANIRRVADRHPDVTFVFENHDGASAHPAVCRDILEKVDRPNARLNFDPINFEHRGANSADAVRALAPLVAHVHLKGYDRGEFCEFGSGELDLAPVVAALIRSGYQGAFTVEYEGRFDRTLGLYTGVRNAQSVIERLRVAS